MSITVEVKATGPAGSGKTIILNRIRELLAINSFDQVVVSEHSLNEANSELRIFQK